MEGYVSIPRFIFDDPSYTKCSIKFTRTAAIIDLIQLARFKEGEEFVNGRFIHLERGQLCKSIRELATRWKWDEKTVMKFLNNLKDSGIIYEKNPTPKSGVNRVISIRNYDAWGKDSNTSSNAYSWEITTENQTAIKEETKEETIIPPSSVEDTKVSPTSLPPRGSVRSRFVPPTVEQVREYCEARENNIDPEAFVDFYETNGWVQGKQGKPIKDWKACVRTWERNHVQAGRINKTTPSGSTMDQYTQALLEIDKQYGFSQGTSGIDEQ